MKYILLGFSFIIIISTIGCVSKIDPYEEDISEVELLQKAYEATDTRNYSLALSYYEAYRERFPEDVKGCLWAEYEIAFLHHKMGNDEKALTLFDELLAKYESEESELLPEAPKVLAEKVIKSILNEEKKKKEKKDKKEKTEE